MMRMYETAVEEPTRHSLAAALRELEAAKMRVQRDARAVSDETRRDLVEKLVPVLDDLDRTIVAAEADGNAPAIVEGAHLVRQHLDNVLRGYGLERVEALEHRFDPRFHDAVATMPVSIPALHQIVLEQLAPGYRFGEHLIRPAKVVVGILRT